MPFKDLSCQLALERRKQQTIPVVPFQQKLIETVAESTNTIVKNDQIRHGFGYVQVLSETLQANVRYTLVCRRLTVDPSNIAASPLRTTTTN